MNGSEAELPASPPSLQQSVTIKEEEVGFKMRRLWRTPSAMETLAYPKILCS